MILSFQRLPELHGPLGDGYNGQVPRRARLLIPDAAQSILALEAENELVYTDIFRSPQSQLAAHRSKGGTQPVSYSAHGYGIAVDLDVLATLQRHSWTYMKLLDVVAEKGWFCHRRDFNPTESESWHFNYLGDGTLISLADPQNHATWSMPAEAMIQELHGAEFSLSRQEIVEGLMMAGVAGIRDDMPDDAFKAAVEIFQRDWDLQMDGIAGPVTQRVLAYVTASVSIVELPNA